MRIIDAGELLPKIINWRESLAETYGKNDEYVKCLGEVLDIIDDVPIIDERREGMWIKRASSLYRCSECARFSPSRENFCPNCGAYMRGDGDANVQ